MATTSEVLTRVPTHSSVTSQLKTAVARIGQAARDWARKGQLGSSATADMGRHTGARI